MRLMSFGFLVAAAAGALLASRLAAAAAPPKAGPAPNYAGRLAATLEPDRRVVYRRSGDRELRLDVFAPPGAGVGERRAALVLIHGGGWGGGAPRAMYPFTAWAAAQGMVGISVEYRLFRPGSDVTVFECVKDVRSAVRYVRAHAAELGVDPARIAVGGASAGGHLAVATELFPFDHADERSGASGRPDALVLLSPVIDTSAAGYGHAKIGARWEELSPVHRVRPDMPPTLTLHGTGDATTPFAGAERFHHAMLAAGNRSELVAVPGAEHTYMFKDAGHYADTQRRLAEFLGGLGFVAARPAPLSAPRPGGALRLPALFSDHMVVQAGKPVNVWGWASAGEAVQVTLAGQTVRTTASPAGTWSLALPAMAASREGQTMTVSAGQTLTVNHVLIGEVWLCSGQSNMEMQMKGLHGQVDDADDEIARADHPRIRMFQHDAVYDIYRLAVPPDQPMSDRPGRWIVCSPQTAAGFIALGYFVGRDLQDALHVPVGLVHSSVGGTPIEAWTSREAQVAEPALAPLLADWRKRLDGYDPAADQQANAAARLRWQSAASSARAKGETPPKAPAAFKNLAVSTPAGLFHGQIAPLVPYTVRGVIWYQGERNAAGPFTTLYGLQLKTLIADWRARWRDDLHFAIVQLPNFQKPQQAPSEPGGWGVSVREGQGQAAKVPRTSVVVTIDLGGPTAGHPTNKAAFAERISRLLRRDVYGQSVGLATGPEVREVTREGAWLRVHYRAAEGLAPRGGELRGFAVAGADRRFVWAEARIEGDAVVVGSPGVKDPVAVRYAWASNPVGNLVNAAGLPAAPYRSDAW